MDLTPLWCALLGMLGGVANSLLLDSGFAVPRTVTLEEGKRIWNPGFIGNLVLGALASVVIYLMGASGLPLLNLYGVSILSGVGGGNLLASLVQKYESSILRVQTEMLERALKAATQAPGGQQG